MFGVVGLNDWSARDLQAWEYVPLEPFLGKSFATSISAWVTPLEALADAWCDLPGQDPRPADYLAPDSARGLDLAVEVEINGEVVSRPPYASTYWGPAQLLAHLTVNGASARTGDLLGSGTISGPGLDEVGSLLELYGGDGSSRTATPSCCATPRRAPRAARSRWARSPGGSSRHAADSQPSADRTAGH